MTSHTNSEDSTPTLSTTTHDSKTHDFVRFLANVSEQPVPFARALEPIHQGPNTHKKSQGGEHTSTATRGYICVLHVFQYRLINDSDSKTDSKADILRSTALDNYGQQERVPGTTSAYILSLKDPKTTSRGVQLSPIGNTEFDSKTDSKADDRQ